MKQLFTICCFLFTSLIHAQELHTPAEIIKIMDDSKVYYSMYFSEDHFEPTDRSEQLNYNYFYRVKTDTSLVTNKYTPDSITLDYLGQAEEFFNNNQFPEAREMYNKALTHDPGHHMALTYIGQTYGIENDYEKAIEYYQKAIAANYIDYMAHWFLADALMAKGEEEKAIKEITVASVLNRNNPRIRTSLNLIYQKGKLNTNYWVFNPQCRIDSTGPDKVSVTANIDWMGYAMVEAVWQYEPGYAENMGGSRDFFSMNRAKEGLIAIGGLIDKKKIKMYPEFGALKLASDNNMIDEYIFYEMLLPEIPFVAYQLPEELVDSISEYVIYVRGKKLKVKSQKSKDN